MTMDFARIQDIQHKLDQGYYMGEKEQRDIKFLLDQITVIDTARLVVKTMRLDQGFLILLGDEMRYNETKKQFEYEGYESGAIEIELLVHLLEACKGGAEVIMLTSAMKPVIINALEERLKGVVKLLEVAPEVEHYSEESKEKEKKNET